MTLRPELRRIVDALLVDVAPGGAVSLDAIGDSLGTMAVSQDEIDAMLTAIEASGKRVTGPEGGHGASTLRTVLEVARTLRAESGRVPSPPEIAARAGLDLERVRHALALARVMAK